MDPNEQMLIVRSGDLSFEIAPALAARVTRMSYQGHNLLVGAEVNPNNWGATYWTSPQADWGWPPVPEVDAAPYEASEQGTGVRLTSPVAQIGHRVFQVEKTFAQGPHVGAIDTCYSIVNRGDVEFKMANWEIARVHPRGVTFFPTGQAELSPVVPHSFMKTSKMSGATFYDHQRFELGSSLKLHADGQEGFLAHATPSHLILKLFRDTLPEQQAPGEGECEIFANFDGKYVEIEVQGPYATIAPGARSEFKVRTAVLELPASLSLSDWEGLLAFARAQAKIFALPDLHKPWESER